MRHGKRSQKLDRKEDCLSVSTYLGYPGVDLDGSTTVQLGRQVAVTCHDDPIIQS